jgi:CBS domain containing-hemolysin-like protein
MKSTPQLAKSGSVGRISGLAAYWLLVSANPARASAFHGETLDAIANAISWVALIIAPIVLITVFLMVHILPEKIAHKKGHPQTPAIQCLCLLSLVFGGLLWPLAWLWAYTKPVLHKVAYGTDQEHGHEPHPASSETEVEQLRSRVSELEAQIKGGKA